MIEALTNLFESVARRFPSVRPLFSLYYDRMCEREILAVRMQPHHRVLFIGAGAYPYSAMMYAKTGAMVTAIDRARAAVISASHYAHERLRFSEADGATFDMAHYDTIIIAKQVEEKQFIINQIKKTANRRVRILVRSGKSCPCAKGCALQSLSHRGRLVKHSWMITL